MSVSNNAKLAAVVITGILIVFALFAILSANSLAWPLLSQFGSNRSSPSNPTPPPTGELIVQANLFSSSNLVTNNATIIAPLSNNAIPIRGNVTISTIVRPEKIVLFNQTANGYLVTNLTQGVYSMEFNSHYSNLTVRISIVTNEITHFVLNVTQIQQMASFYDLVDRDSSGQVLPSDSIYLEINGTVPQINSTQLVDLQTYGYSPCQPLVGPGFGLLICPTFSTIQSVPVSIASMGQSSSNASTWFVLTPQSPIYTAGVRYVELSSFNSSYSISISNSTGGAPIA